MVGNSTPSRWQRGQCVDEDARLFGLFGWGFVTTSSGRVFLPLIGRPKAVPSAEAERLHTGGRRRKWLVAIAAVALCIAIIWTFNAFPLNSIARAAVILSGPLVILGLSFWRDRALTKSWANIEGASRTDLIVSALSLIPSSRLLTVLCAELIFWGFMLYLLAAELAAELAAWLATRDPSDLDGGLWSVGLFVFALYAHRWCLMLAALIRRL